MSFTHSRVKTIFMAMRHKIDDMKARNTCMDIMRELFRQYMSMLILEKTKLEQQCIYLALPVRADGRFFEVGLSQTFLEYGLWQDYGVGRETPRGNSGDIGRAKKRKRRRWFSKKYYASVKRLGEFYEENLGKQFCGLIADTFNDKNFRRNH